MKTANNSISTRQSAAPKQTLAPRPSAAPLVTYKDTNGNELQLSTDIIKAYLVSGGDISDEEAFMYLNLCKFNGLNPFLKESYCIKFGNSPATMVVAKDTFTKRAQHNPKFRGMKAGVVVVNRNNELENRVGEIVLDGEELVGGWADVYVENYVAAISATVSLSERCQYKDGKQPSGKWATAPALMIRKCALVAALREAFPDSLGGLYSTEEMGYEEVETNSAPIAPPTQKHDVSKAVDVEPTTGEVIGDDEDMETLFGGEE